MNKELDRQIRNYQPRDGSFVTLETHFEEAFSSVDPRAYYDAIFNLFERFPDDDGNGVFWSAIHGMEHIGEYEDKLLMYFRRFPSLMTRTMLIRIRNAGSSAIGGVEIATLVDD